MNIDRPAIDAARTRTASADELRDTFLIEGLFVAGEVTTHHTAEDRMLVAGVVPSAGELALAEIDALGPDGLAGREFGVVNIGGPGEIVVDGESYALDHRDGLYAGRGSALSFRGADARFYVVATLADERKPTVLIPFADTVPVHIGDENGAGRRALHKFVWGGGDGAGGEVDSCQLQFGITVLEPGAVWNTFPPHLHERRTEIYLYFELGDAAVIHLLGEPAHTRHVVVRDEQAVIAPRWSIHSGAGTGRYSFIWAMAGDNRDYGDLAPVPLGDLR